MWKFGRAAIILGHPPAELDGVVYPSPPPVGAESPKNTISVNCQDASVCAAHCVDALEPGEVYPPKIPLFDFLPTNHIDNSLPGVYPSAKPNGRVHGLIP